MDAYRYDRLFVLQIKYPLILQQRKLVDSCVVPQHSSPQPSDRYLGSRVKKTLNNPIVEYRQANLSNPVAVSSVFDPPAGEAPWDYVFDVSGEVRFDRQDEVMTISSLESPGLTMLLDSTRPHHQAGQGIGH